MPDLNEAVEAMYRVFECPPPATIPGCRHCLDDTEIGRLLTTRLRETSPDDLGTYASSVFLTVGSTSDFRYFLPRIFEVAVNTPSWFPGPEILGRALASAGWLAWRAGEAGAVREVLAAWLETRLAPSRPDGYAIDTLICAIGRAEADMQPFLDAVLQYPAAVTAFAGANPGAIRHGFLSNGFWRGHDGALLDANSRACEAQVLAFLRSDAVFEIVGP